MRGTRLLFPRTGTRDDNSDKMRLQRLLDDELQRGLFKLTSKMKIK